MKLNEWVSQKRGRIVWLARQMGVSQPTVSDYVAVRVPPEKAPLIERLTDRQVTCEEMCPQVEWHVLRDQSLRGQDLPELATPTHPRADLALHTQGA